MKKVALFAFNGEAMCFFPAKMLELVDLPGTENIKPAELSGGMKKMIYHLSDMRFLTAAEVTGCVERLNVLSQVLFHQFQII